MNTSPEYGFEIELDRPYESAVEAVKTELKKEGFGVLTEIDVKSTLKQKLDVDFQKYVILGACNPHLANRALRQDLSIGLLLPCNVVVYESSPGKSVVSIIDPIAMMGMTSAAGVEAIADEASAKLRRVHTALAAG